MRWWCEVVECEVVEFEVVDVHHLIYNELTYVIIICNDVTRASLDEVV
jgi:hypothetical protein